MPLHPVPDDLGDRGRQLWEDFGASKEGDPGSRLLIHEVCRIADDLERLHRLMRGEVDDWVTVTLPRTSGEDEELVLRVDNALTHRRLLVTTLRQTMQDLRRIRPDPLADGDRDPAPPSTDRVGGGDPVDEFTARRAARRADAADHARAAGGDERRE